MPLCGAGCKARHLNIFKKICKTGFFEEAMIFSKI